MRKLALASILAVVLVLLPAAASAKVRLVRVTSPVPRGDKATLTAKVSTSKARCKIEVRYKSGVSHAKGLSPKSTVRQRVSWTWTVVTNTTPGRWPIVVSCGTAGQLRTSFVVK